MKRIIYILTAIVLFWLPSCKQEKTYYDTAATVDAMVPTEYEVGQPITFTDNSKPTVGSTIIAYLWEFGDKDSTTSSQQNPTFTYQQDGDFVVKFTVTDSHNLQASKTFNLRITNPTTALFTTQEEKYFMGDVVQFVNQSTAKAPTTITGYLWEFGDENHTTSTVKDPTFTYTQAGAYTITLTVTDSRGLKAIFAKNVSIKDPTKLIAIEWSVPIGGAIKGGSSPVLSPDGQTVYTLRSLAGTDNTALLAYNTVDGSPKWSLDLSEAMIAGGSEGAQAKDVYSSPSVAPDGTIYVVVRDLQGGTRKGVHVLAVNPDKTVKWVYKNDVAGTNLYAITPAIDAQGNCYVATRGKELWKLSPTGSATITNVGVDITGGVTLAKDGTAYVVGKAALGLMAVVNNAVTWTYNTDFGGASSAITGVLRSTPATIGTDGTVYYAYDKTAGGAIVALNNGTPTWTYETTGGIPDGGIVLAEDGTIYCNGGTDTASSVIALTSTGSLKWKKGTLAEVQTSPLLDDRGYIHAIDKLSNYVIFKPDGTQISSLKLGTANISCPVMDAKGMLYITITDGETAKLLCVSSDASSYNTTSPWPMRGQNPCHTGLQK